MIRVIYRWTVETATRESFIEEWQRLTGWIRGEFQGAHGSTLLQGDDNTSLVGIARWESDVHLQAFRDQAGSLHLPGAHLDSMEVLREITNLTDEA